MLYSKHNQKIIKDVIDGVIPTSIPNFELEDSGYYHMRNIIALQNGMWLYIYKDYAKQLSKWLDGRSALDPMAGRGWLAKALRDEGIKVNASDLNPRGWSSQHNYVPVTNVVEMDIRESIQKSKDDVLILSWVPYDFDVIKESSLWGEERPILFLGELGGCCSTDSYANIVQNLKTFKYERSLEPYNWYGIHDSAYSYTWNDTIMKECLNLKESFNELY